MLMLMYFKYSKEEITPWTISLILFKLLWKWITAIAVAVDAIAGWVVNFKRILSVKSISVSDPATVLVERCLPCTI